MAPQPSQSAPSDPQTAAWEAAYLRFESAEQEIAKFTERLERAGARDWPRTWRVAELFCGRGNGLHALSRLGFTNLEGVDLSPRLIAQYRGTGRCQVGDCRHLPFAERSMDLLVIQGGLHHLPSPRRDLEPTLAEARRVLAEHGRLVIVEPWLTPFLSFVHRVCDSRVARRLSSRVDALAVMIEHERETYEAWLAEPEWILATLERHFVALRREIAWGKLAFTGRPRHTDGE